MLVQGSGFTSVMSAEWVKPSSDRVASSEKPVRFFPKFNKQLFTLKRNQENGSNSGNFSFSTPNTALKRRIGTGFRVYSQFPCVLVSLSLEVNCSALTFAFASWTSATLLTNTFNATPLWTLAVRWISAAKFLAAATVKLVW